MSAGFTTARRFLMAARTLALVALLSMSVLTWALAPSLPFWARPHAAMSLASLAVALRCGWPLAFVMPTEIMNRSRAIAVVGANIRASPRASVATRVGR